MLNDDPAVCFHCTCHAILPAQGTRSHPSHDLQAAKAEKEKARQQQEYAEVAAREAARHKRMRDKARQEYEAAEARREEDLAKRIAAEQELSRQRAEERRKAEEALHKAQEVDCIPKYACV